MSNWPNARRSDSTVAKRKANLKESMVIYWSDEDKCWIAHTLKTDQIGTGERIVDALADVLKALQMIHEEASKDRSLAVLRDAPKEIQDMRRTAKKLPMEIYEVAHKMVHGKWPEDWNPPEPKKGKNKPFQAQIQDMAFA
jgi:hypothetical protein